jgi:hypothetical protein
MTGFLGSLAARACGDALPDSVVPRLPARFERVGPAVVAPAEFELDAGEIEVAVAAPARPATARHTPPAARAVTQVVNQVTAQMAAAAPVMSMEPAPAIRPLGQDMPPLPAAAPVAPLPSAAPAPVHFPAVTAGPPASPPPAGPPPKPSPDHAEAATWRRAEDAPRPPAASASPKPGSVQPLLAARVPAGRLPPAAAPLPRPALVPLLAVPPAPRPPRAPSPALPPAPAAPAAPAIQVTIGRVEVRAAVAAPEPRRGPLADPVMGLQDYLRLRSERRSR